MPSTIHPEHYYFDADKMGRQVIIETFGMYKDPSYFDLKPGSKEDYPVKPAKDVDIVMAGKTFLRSNSQDTKMQGMHQLTNTPTGMKVKLGVFLPENAPKEIAEGHKWHLMFEFNNGLHIAAKQHPNFVQKKVLETAINRMKKKQLLRIAEAKCLIMFDLCEDGFHPCFRQGSPNRASLVQLHPNQCSSLQVKQFLHLFFKCSALCILQCVAQLNVVLINMDLMPESKNVTQA